MSLSCLQQWQFMRLWHTWRPRCSNRHCGVSAALPPKSAGLLTHGRDGHLRMVTAARINHEAGLLDRVGSFVFGLGGKAPGYDSAALCLVRLTSRGVLDPGFGANGSVVTPLLPLDNHDRAHRHGPARGWSGRSIVVGWRYILKGLDSSVPVILAARYTSSGGWIRASGERGIVTTRVDKAGVTQAFAATLDSDGRLLVVRIQRRPRRARASDRSTTRAGSRHPAALHGERRIGRVVRDRLHVSPHTSSSRADPADRRDVSSCSTITATQRAQRWCSIARDGTDRRGRGDNGPIVLVRYTKDGKLRLSFGSAGTVQTPAESATGISGSLLGVPKDVCWRRARATATACCYGIRPRALWIPPLATVESERSRSAKACGSLRRAAGRDGQSTHGGIGEYQRPTRRAVRPGRETGSGLDRTA